MKLQKIISLAAALAVSPLTGWGAVSVVADVTVPGPGAPPPQAMAPMEYPMSHPARDVMKLVASGVGNDVVKAYVANAPSSFNLNSDNIIRLQQSGVASGVIADMLDHDRNLRATASAPPNVPQAYPPMTAYPPQDYGATQQAQPDYAYNTQPDSDYYGQLAPYGNWNYVANYGWGWQANPGLDYSYYSWPVLGLGFWWNCPGRGWCWFPHGGSRGWNGGFVGGYRGGFRSGFFDRGFRGGFAGRNGFASHSFGGFNRGATGFRGGFSGGLHGSVHSFGGGGGSHFSGGGGHAGGFSGGHAGGGSSGGHGGGGHR